MAVTVKLPPNFPRDYMIDGIVVNETSKLGEGAYGVVKLAKYHGLTVAVKQLLPSFFPVGVDTRRLDDEAQVILESFFNECSKLSKIRHPNVIQLLGITLDKHTNLPCIVMELMHESLTRLLKRSPSLLLYTEVNICHDVAKGLAYLHGAFSPPIVHRDLSSNNILISRECHAKVTDLGVSKFEASSFLQRLGNTPAPGTMAYMAPEVRKIPADCSPAMDIFAFGVIAVQMRSHKFPNPGPDQEKSKFGLPKAILEVERRQAHIKLFGRNHPMRTIALDCLRNSPKGRPTALQICSELEGIKDTAAYKESQLAHQIKEGEADHVRERISILENNLDKVKYELQQKESEMRHLGDEVEQHKKKNIKGSPKATSSGHEAKKSDKPRRKFFRKKDSIRLKSSTTGDDCSHDFSLSSEDEPFTGSEFEIVTPRSVLSAELGIEIDTLKKSTFKWQSHRCLREGLHGLTFRAHRTHSRIFLCGGATGTDQPNISVYFCPRRNITRWAKVATDAIQYYCASVVYRTELVLIGGFSTANHRCTSLISTYDFAANVWLEKLPQLPTACSSAAATIWNDYLFVLGGTDDSGRLLDTIQVLHLSRQQWVSVFPLPFAVAGASAVTYQGRIYVLGGMTGEGLTRRVYSFSPDQLLATASTLAKFTKSSSHIWLMHQDSPCTVMSCCIYSNHLLAAGGIESTGSMSAPSELLWRLNVNNGEEEKSKTLSHTGNWTVVSKMHTARKLCAIVPVSSSTLAVAGGNPYYSVLDIAEIMPPNS